MSKESPILFSASMVRAILEGRKTQTRRIVKRWHFNTGCEGINLGFSGLVPSEVSPGLWRLSSRGEGGCWQERCGAISPYGKPGDRLWVRETFWSQDGRPHCFQMAGNGAGALDPKLSAMTHAFTAYRAQWGDLKPEGCTRWKPAIHMPRALSRINLEVTSVRVERLLDITESDAKAEGASPWEYGPEQCLTSGERGALSPYRSGFACLWDEINADRATWKSNPWVWVVEFKRI